MSICPARYMDSVGAVLTCRLTDGHREHHDSGAVQWTDAASLPTRSQILKQVLGGADHVRLSRNVDGSVVVRRVKLVKVDEDAYLFHDTVWADDFHEPVWTDEKDHNEWRPA